MVSVVTVTLLIDRLQRTSSQSEGSRVCRTSHRPMLAQLSPEAPSDAVTNRLQTTVILNRNRKSSCQGCVDVLAFIVVLLWYRCCRHAFERARRGASLTSGWAGWAPSVVMAPQVSITLDENMFTLYLSPDDWFSRGHCSTLAIVIDCPTAADYRPG